GAEHGLDLRELGAIERLTLADGGDDAVIDRPRIVVGDDLLAVVDLVVEAELLLVGAAADAGDDADDERVAVAGRDPGGAAEAHRPPPRRPSGPERLLGGAMTADNGPPRRPGNRRSGCAESVLKRTPRDRE